MNFLMSGRTDLQLSLEKSPKKNYTFPHSFSMALKLRITRADFMEEVLPRRMFKGVEGLRKL